MATYTKFNAFIENVFEAVHNFEPSAHSLKAMLTNTAPTASNSVKADLTEISSGNGYTAGGNALTISSSAQTSGTLKVVVADSTWTASGGSIGPFRYVVIYNDTPTNPADPLIAYYDYGSSITLASGSSFTTDFSATNGVFQAA
jgi:hypothetical protein